LKTAARKGLQVRVLSPPPRFSSFTTSAGEFMESSGYTLIGFGILVLLSLLGGWLATRRKRIKLEEGLGRKVKDEEVTSISAWMEADDKVVSEVVHDDSLNHKVEDVMEDAVSYYGDDR
jgi:LPXTG-motif cell wall-anchored protein